LTYLQSKTNNQSQLTAAEYFAGIGLVRLGLEAAGWQVSFANDWSYEKFVMYSAYFHDANQHYRIQDIFSILPTDLPATLLATASFPCVDLSLAGNLKGMQGQESSAFWGFTQILEHQHHRPQMILLENVTGWLTANHSQDFCCVIKALNRLGYACDLYAIDAAHFVPQSRPRIFVVGMLNCFGNRDFSILERRSSNLKTAALKKALTIHQDLNWHFLNVPALPDKVTINLGYLIESICDDDPRWWSENEVQRHLNMMSACNLNYLQTLRNLPDYSYCSMYRRVRGGQQRAELRKDGIAGCLRTVRGGSSRQMLVRVGQGAVSMRVMTPREYARLQGVPEDYPIPVNINQALTGFGDAVCVPVITWIATHILNPLVTSLPEQTLVLHA
jgi:DNA (cytosine-5)-methyltransferase 1